MSLTVCLAANTLSYPQGGGHLWVYLNWALGLRALGCRVIWLETVEPDRPTLQVRALVASLRSRLQRHGLAELLALCPATGSRLAADALEGCLEDPEADLLLNLQYSLHPDVVRRFRRSALIDIDPGLFQIWWSGGHIEVAEHDIYFSIGETVGRPGARFPDAGRVWHYTPPCVALDAWPACPAPPGAPFTTVSHWYEDEWVEDAGGYYRNDKRSGFEPFLDLPRHTAQPLELALCLADDEEDDRRLLQERGWRVRQADSVTSTPWDYQGYIQASQGEFSCVKPSCVRLANAWVSDRTLCYLASGKPAVVQNTGPSRFLPDAEGLFRFRDVEDAAGCLEAAAADYERQSRQARALAEEFFDAPKVAKHVLERALA
jgi:glycosyltransferase involved in cell wall biosynthesis